jgi:hypothetical protein
MNPTPRAIVLATAITLLCSIACAPAARADQLSAGMLTCHAASGFGWIIGSSRTIDCQYVPWDGRTERYSGTISKIGIDIGYLAPLGMVWAVIAPSGASSTGILAGNYFGATVQAAALVGGGVNVLTGGFQRSVTLQPVSIEGDAGLYIGAGIAAMNLKLDDRGIY